MSGLFGGGGGDDKSSKSSRSKKTSKASRPSVKTEDGLTLDNWLDIGGVFLVFASLVLFFSAISRDQAAISRLHNIFGEAFGWGALAVPIAMFVIGMWLIIRHFGDDAPTVDPIRVVGVVLAYISLLVIFQYIDSFSYNELIALDGGAVSQAMLRARLNIAWDEYQAGGGFIGAQIYYFLVLNVTEVGGFLLILFSLLISAMLITRLTAAEIVTAVAGIGMTIRDMMKQQAQKRRIERDLATQRAAEILAAQQAQMAMDGAPNQPPQGDMMPPPTAAEAAMPEEQRSIRFNRGGDIQVVNAQAAQGAPPVNNGRQYAPPQYAPQQYAPAQQPQQNNNSSSGGLFGRFRGGNNNSNNNTSNGTVFGGIFGSSDNGAPPPPPIESPLPMDDGYSHFDNTVPVASQNAPRGNTITMGELMGQPPPPRTTPANGTPQQAQQSPPPPQQQPAASAESAGKSDADEAAARQARLDALRRGEVGPLSQQNMAEARREAVVRQRDNADEKPPMTIRVPAASQQSSQNQASYMDDNDNVRPSQLPSVQPDGNAGVRQQRLAAMPEQEQPRSSRVQSTRTRIEWDLPDFKTLLSSGSEQEFDREMLLTQARTIEDTLKGFGQPGRVVEVNTGPVITQFGVEPDYVEGRGGRKQRVKVSAIAGLDKDLQLALGARSIRVEAPVPGKGYVGIEVPNPEPSLVSLRDVMDSPSFSKHKTPLAIALGQSVSGAPISADLSTMPHLLIAGTTGSGKSVCVNSVITSIIARHTPEEVKFIMVDPKRVELTGYNGIPHLVAPVVVDLERIVGVLKWVTREMDDRYKKFSDAGARNIEDYNRHIDPSIQDPMPYLVVIIDELADLMMLAPEETERTITRIAALARATGIHLVIATQRPSVDVVTGLIKANFPARIAFAVAGSVDSRVILDQPGAERLLGKGDMLYLSGDSPAPLRLQGVYVSDMEIQNIVRYWKMQAVKYPESTRPATMSSQFEDRSSSGSMPSRSERNANMFSSGQSMPSFATGSSSSFDDDDDSDVELTRRELTGDVKDGNEDELYDKAVELVRRLDKASISLLQRRLRIGYTRAARLIDVMEARGVVGPSKEGSSKPRDVIPE